MNYYILSPEVAGGLGANTIIDRSCGPFVVTKLHYHFDGWLGDSLLEAVATFIVTDSMRVQLQSSNATGVAYDVVEISKSEEYDVLFPECNLPRFVWLKITGEAGVDDFGMSLSHRLVVSERILGILQQGRLHYCDIENYKKV